MLATRQFQSLVDNDDDEDEREALLAIEHDDQWEGACSYLVFGFLVSIS